MSDKPFPLVWKCITDGAYWLGRVCPDGTTAEYFGSFTYAGDSQAEADARAQKLVDAINAAEGNAPQDRIPFAITATAGNLAEVRQRVRAQPTSFILNGVPMLPSEADKIESGDKVDWAEPTDA